LKSSKGKICSLQDWSCYKFFHLSQNVNP
jgi:hypothetical protein